MKSIESLYTNVPWSKGKVILMAYAGSIAYGTNTPTSDIDLRGILIPPQDFYYGLDSFESYHSPEGDRTEDDVVVYSIKKYANLALQNNPNVLEMLFTNPKHYTILNRFGRELCRARYNFLSKKTFNTFSGYALAQLHRMTQNEGKPTHGQGNPERQKIREQFGYDTKAAMHLVRLMRMGLEILRDGNLIVHRPDAEELLDIKRGKYTLQEIVEEHDRLYEQMKYWKEASDLPEKPNRDKVNSFIIELTKEFLGGK